MNQLDEKLRKLTQKMDDAVQVMRDIEADSLETNRKIREASRDTDAFIVGTLCCVIIVLALLVFLM